MEHCRICPPVLSRPCLSGLDLREIDIAGDLVEVVPEDVVDNVRDVLHDLAIRQAAGERVLELRVTDFAALDNDVSREFQDRVGFEISGTGANGIDDLFFAESDFAAHKCVSIQAITAKVAFRDREADLLPDLAIESSLGESGAEIEITLERRGRRRALGKGSAQHQICPSHRTDAWSCP